ncbi:H-2 class I histocompatibility antigen, alpha chain-like [Sinocyclocheilus rhinocerous]|uniref:H-2 class I histocompatibility antigen, alpha chain-like n=1 Tax=Sinocyclocheilus rhinocerous TaxID=307959 RepID=UPI0007BA1694|nr:PREDICTED: H-2 class I histocompatibility antigen, alpha chain-like [Sinocyclocheilus rhinocerous]
MCVGELLQDVNSASKLWSDAIPADFRTLEYKKHHLCYMFSVLTVKAQISLGPWASVAVCDDKQVAYYSNENKKWIRESLTIDEPPDSRDWYLHQLNTLSNCTVSQCSELHVLQRMVGCDLVNFPDGTVSLRAFDEYGFDGEDFLAFNSDALQWIDKNPKAKETKMKWDLQTGRNKFIKKYLNNCMNWISTFNNTKKNSPDVRVFARRAPDDHNKMVLSCLTTGFYPRDIEMNIRLDRINIQNQISSGIRPNGDGSFQLRTSVEIDRNHEGSYDCFVIHSSLTEPASIKWDGICINCETEFLWLVIAGAPVLILVLTVIACIYKKKRSNDLICRSEYYGEVRNGSEPFSHGRGCD